MRARKKLNPSQDGAKSLLNNFGEQLVCARYPYDDARKLYHKAVKRIISVGRPAHYWKCMPNIRQVFQHRIQIGLFSVT